MIGFFYQSKSLSPGSYYTVVGLDDKPKFGFRVSEEGHLFSQYSVAKDKHRNDKIVIKNSNRQKGSYIEDDQPCIDWFWQEWDAETGELVSESYVFSTGCEEANGSNWTGSGSSESPDGPRLCVSSYPWSTVGNSYTSNINKLYYDFTNGSITLSSRIEESCVTIPNYNINEAEAAIIFNFAFNFATDEVARLLAQGLLPKTNLAVKTAMKGLIQTYLTISKPGARISYSPCKGTLNTKVLNAGSFC